MGFCVVSVDQRSGWGRWWLQCCLLGVEVGVVVAVLIVRRGSGGGGCSVDS